MEHRVTIRQGLMLHQPLWLPHDDGGDGIFFDSVGHSFPFQCVYFYSYYCYCDDFASQFIGAC